MEDEEAGDAGPWSQPRVERFLPEPPPYPAAPVHQPDQVVTRVQTRSQTRAAQEDPVVEAQAQQPSEAMRTGAAPTSGDVEDVPLGGDEIAEEEVIRESLRDVLLDIPPPEVPDDGEELDEYAEGDLDNLTLSLRPQQHVYRRRYSKGGAAEEGDRVYGRRVRADCLAGLQPLSRHALLMAVQTSFPSTVMVALSSPWPGAVQVTVSEGRRVLAMTALPEEPRTLTQALKGPDAVGWRAACDLEFNALRNRGTWELVPRPPGR
jgi:hypothetical protein